MSEEKKEKTKGKRCSRCGFRIRGKNHEEGVHHQQGRNRTTGNHLRKSQLSYLILPDWLGWFIVSQFNATAYRVTTYVDTGCPRGRNSFSSNDLEKVSLFFRISGETP